MNSESSKNDVSKSVGAVGSATETGSGVSTGSVGSGSGSVATVLVSGNVVSLVVATVVTDVVTAFVVVATVVALVVLIDVFAVVAVSLGTSELSCEEVTSAQLHSATAIALIKATADVLKAAEYFISIYHPDFYDDCFCK